jgi:hypothetical protein
VPGLDGADLVITSEGLRRVAAVGSFVSPSFTDRVEFAARLFSLFCGASVPSFEQVMCVLASGEIDSANLLEGLHHATVDMRKLQPPEPWFDDKFDGPQEDCATCGRLTQARFFGGTASCFACGCRSLG